MPEYNKVSDESTSPQDSADASHRQEVEIRSPYLKFLTQQSASLWLSLFFLLNVAFAVGILEQNLSTVTVIGTVLFFCNMGIGYIGLRTPEDVRYRVDTQFVVIFSAIGAVVALSPMVSTTWLQVKVLGPILRPTS